MNKQDSEIMVSDIIGVPVDRYDELIRAELERDLLLRAYHNHDQYALQSGMELVFGPKPEDKEDAE